MIAHFRGQKLGQMICCTLGGVVGKVSLRFSNTAGNGGDVDDCAGIARVVLGRLLQQGEEGGSHHVQLGDIGRICIRPFGECGALGFEQVLLEVCAGLAFGLLVANNNTGVVDEDAEAFLAGFDLFDQVGDLILFRDVAGERDDLAWDVLAMGFDDVLQLLFGAADDVDLGAVDCKGLCCHETNAGACSRLS